MPTTPHIEKHFTATETVRDVVIGMSDGLTVPFALAAGSIAMGLGGYLAARTDSEHYHAEQEREYREIVEVPAIETREVAEVFEGYGLTPEQAAPVVAAVCAEPKRWVDFMMRYELGLEAPDPRRAVRSAATIAVSYIVGGMIPLSPYVAAGTVVQGLWISVLVTLIALFVFGYVKGRLTGIHPFRGGLRTVVIGGLAAGAAFALARAIS